jgi:hypothetical protein
MLVPHGNVAPPLIPQKSMLFNEPNFIKQSADKLLGTCSVPDCFRIGGKI